MRQVGPDPREIFLEAPPPETAFLVGGIGFSGACHGGEQREAEEDVGMEEVGDDARRVVLAGNEEVGEEGDGLPLYGAKETKSTPRSR